MPTVLACLRRSVERMWPPRVPTRFGPGTRLRRPKNQWNQGPLATPQAETCPRTANSGQRGHADAWQICLAHQLRDLRHAIEAGDAAFAPRMRVLLPRAVLLARRRLELKASTRLEYRRRLERELDRTLALQPTNRHGQRLRKRYLAVRDGLFTFLEHPEAPPDNNGSERELRPMATYRKVTGGSRSARGPDLCAAIKSVVGTAARPGIDAYHAILAVLSGRTVLDSG